MRKVEIKKMPVLLISGYDDSSDESSDYQITVFKTGTMSPENKPMLGIVYEDAFGEFHLQEKSVEDTASFYDVDKNMLEEMIELPYDKC